MENLFHFDWCPTAMESSDLNIPPLRLPFERWWRRIYLPRVCPITLSRKVNTDMTAYHKLCRPIQNTESSSGPHPETGFTPTDIRAQAMPQ
ncbi:unnamed protein product [Caretta caretta]